MKYYIFFLFIQVIFTVNLESAKFSDVKIFSTSPIGPYKLVFKQIYSANSTKNNKLQYNFYLSHKDNKTTVFGNITTNIPLDDTLFVGVKIAVKDSSGRWKENSLMQKWQNACSTLKQFAGNAWSTFLYGFGVNHTNCPIPKGFYIAPGVDTSILKNSNLPKTFLYGTYKVHIYLSQQNEIVGGQVVIVELKRP
ncbi:uncharacterized protein LOC113549859 [Rhopalosiphum maidis]|uniref:uncharacterized protein LOC113549859 n=1 Tax=Rhopalosiphum maidis TaxID=43146 RepID=UPI000EFFA0A5|nr:uncharacterized protein LOC113549859 [Rhopalosiphum maidis]